MGPISSEGAWAANGPAVSGEDQVPREGVSEFTLEHQVALHFPRGLTVFLVTGVLLMAGHAALAFSTGPLGDGKLAFTVTRNGEPIGSQVYTFNRHGARTVVEIKTDIDFRLLSLPIYRFQHQSREVWDGDRLVRLVSNTNDNGDPLTLDVRAEGPVLKVGAQNKSVEVDPKAIPASLWNRAVVKRERLLDTVKGTLLNTIVTDLGDDTVTVAGKAIPARRFRLSGDYHRELWYGKRDGTLVRVLFEAIDGSEVEYVLTP